MSLDKMKQSYTKIFCAKFFSPQNINTTPQQEALYAVLLERQNVVVFWSATSFKKKYICIFFFFTVKSNPLSFILLYLNHTHVWQQCCFNTHYKDKPYKHVFPHKNENMCKTNLIKREEKLDWNSHSFHTQLICFIRTVGFDWQKPGDNQTTAIRFRPGFARINHTQYADKLSKNLSQEKKIKRRENILEQVWPWCRQLCQSGASQCGSCRLNTNYSSTWFAAWRGRSPPL